MPAVLGIYCTILPSLPHCSWLPHPEVGQSVHSKRSLDALILSLQKLPSRHDASVVHQHRHIANLLPDLLGSTVNLLLLGAVHHVGMSVTSFLTYLGSHSTHLHTQRSQCIQSYSIYVTIDDYWLSNDTVN